MNKEFIKDFKEASSLFKSFDEGKIDDKKFQTEKKKLIAKIEKKYKKAVADYVFYSSFLESFFGTVDYINKKQS